MSWQTPSLSGLEEGAVSILDAETSRDVTFFIIQVALKSGESWKVARRYSQFKDLHDKLLSMFSIGDSNLLHLPPKRIFNNNDPTFIQKRRAELQEYLRSVILNLVPPCPQPLKVFLAENLYDFNDLNYLASSKMASSPKTDTPQTMAVDSAWGDGNHAPLIDMRSPGPETNPAFDSMFGTPSSKAATPRAAGLDAFGMPTFGGEGDWTKNANSSNGSNASIIPTSFPSAAAVATPTSFKPTNRDEKHVVGKSKWFDHEPAKRSGEVRLGPTEAALVRDSLNISADGKQQQQHQQRQEHQQQQQYQTRSNTISTLAIPAFPDLHRKIREQMITTYSNWKDTTGSTVFVDDLISF